jgi:hypothetical protein
MDFATEMLLKTGETVRTPTRPRRVVLVRLSSQEEYRVGQNGKVQPFTRIYTERVDFSRYPGAALREIRATGQKRECERRLRQRAA